LGKIRESKKASEADSVRVSTTDPEARVMKQPDGGFAPSYNVQLSTDAANKLIVGVSVSQSGNDYGELLPAMEQVEKTFETKPAQVVADGGFTTRDNILAMAAAGLEFYGSLREANPDSAGQLARRGVSREFYPSAFDYDAPTDRYRCPAEQTLHHVGRKERFEVIEHSYRAQRGVCEACTFRDQCCGQRRDKGKGRTVVRLEERPEVTAFCQKMQTEEAAKIYRQRSAVAEFPHAWIKAKLGLRQFRLRGLLKAGMEALWACLTYNIQQWIRLSWRAKPAGGAA
jgi:transposase